MHFCPIAFYINLLTCRNLLSSWRLVLFYVSLSQVSQFFSLHDDCGKIIEKFSYRKKKIRTNELLFPQIALWNRRNKNWLIFFSLPRTRLAFQNFCTYQKFVAILTFRIEIVQFQSFSLSDSPKVIGSSLFYLPLFQNPYSTYSFWKEERTDIVWRPHINLHSKYFIAIFFRAKKTRLKFIL